MQEICGKSKNPQIAPLHTGRESNRPGSTAFLPDMETIQTRVIGRINFWKGIMLGTMAGMAVAAFTYSVADPFLKRAGQTRA